MNDELDDYALLRLGINSNIVTTQDDLSWTEIDDDEDEDLEAASTWRGADWGEGVSEGVSQNTRNITNMDGRTFIDEGLTVSGRTTFNGDLTIENGITTIDGSLMVNGQISSHSMDGTLNEYDVILSNGDTLKTFRENMIDINAELQKTTTDLYNEVSILKSQMSDILRRLEENGQNDS